jgi:hypothetical protein
LVRTALCLREMNNQEKLFIAKQASLIKRLVGQLDTEAKYLGGKASAGAQRYEDLLRGGMGSKTTTLRRARHNNYEKEYGRMGTSKYEPGSRGGMDGHADEVLKSMPFIRSDGKRIDNKYLRDFWNRRKLWSGQPKPPDIKSEELKVLLTRLLTGGGLAGGAAYGLSGDDNA